MDKSSESLYHITGMVKNDSRYDDKGVYLSMWTKAHKAMINVLDNTTIQNLLDHADLLETL